MTAGQLKSIAPYLVGLALAAVLFVYTGHIVYTPRAGELGPDTWPKMAIALMAAACVFEIVRRLMLGATLTRGVVDMLEQGHDEEETTATHPWMLAGGVALVTVYALVVNTLGFLLATFLFMAAFMYLGRYRNHVAIWSIGVAATLVIALLFMRIAYVSLPRGEPPFDRFTDFVRMIVG
jgi:hypothetical protein